MKAKSARRCLPFHLPADAHQRDRPPVITWRSGISRLLPVQPDDGVLKTLSAELSARDHPDLGAESAEHVSVDPRVSESTQ
jgi:hypothetical protein